MKNNKHIFLYQCKEKEQLDAFAVKTIQEQQDLPFVPLTIKNAQEIAYDTTDLCCLQEYENEKLTKGTIWKIISEISQMLYKMEDLMLNPENISLSSKDIFIDHVSEQIKLVYYPVSNGSRSGNDLVFERLVHELWQYVYQEPAQYDICYAVRNKSENEDDLQANQTKDCLQEEARYGQTTVLQSLQEAAEKSKRRIMRRKAGETCVLAEEKDLPFLIRKKNGEKIMICGNIFKLGKDKEYVDYCIWDNPAISKSHADILKQNHEYYIMDQRSLNATMVNGRKVPPKQLIKLHTTDSIILANEKFDFYRNESAFK